MKKLRIAQIAPLWFPIPPKKYGGTERIASYLTETLVTRGHEVTLFASGDSQTKAKLISVHPTSLIEAGVSWSDTLTNNHNLSVAFSMADQFDVIHSHVGLWTAFFQPFVKTPVIQTMHNIPGPTDWRWKFFEYYKEHYNPVFISEKERQNTKVIFPKSWIIYNGIDLSEYQFSATPQDHFVWIARVSPEKGPENAIEAARRLDAKLLLAGQIQTMRMDYFENAIKPRLSDQIHYLGELAREELSGFYGSAKALLYPIEWEEPFGLVVTEAMACGTPVIAFRRGSMPEIIEDGKNGFLVNTVDEMAEAMKHIDTIDRAMCRKIVEEKFSKEMMTEAYEKAYYELLGL